MKKEKRNKTMEERKSITKLTKELEMEKKYLITFIEQCDSSYLIQFLLGIVDRLQKKWV